MSWPGTIRRFQASRRGAIAMMFALCLVPLVLMVGLATDYSFYVQSSQQVSRAAEAAATQAVRTAAAGYALDIANNQTIAQATADAIAQGKLAGQQWFGVQSTNLVRGSASTPTVNVTSATGANGQSAGFTATVNYVFTYPPFFSGVFNRPSSTNWSYPNTTSAQAVNQFVEVLMLLDTSASMEIGAGQSDIQTLSKNTVCLPQVPGLSTTGLSPLNFPGLGYQYPYDTYSSQMIADGDTIDFSTITGNAVVNGKTVSVYAYNDPSHGPNDLTGTCNTAQGYGVLVSPNTSAAQPVEPCALACHTSSTLVNGNYADSYGQARALGVTLRLDVVLKAAEQVAADLYSSEQSSNQFTLGVYQFNSDVSTMVTGGNGDALAEATNNLTAAQTAIENYDYAYKGNNALLPALQTLGHNTNFPAAIGHLVNGGGSVPTLSQVTNTQANPAGSTAANPIKNIFIVTDGFEDIAGNGQSLDFGEMTSSTAENYYTSTGGTYGGNATAYCSKLKSLGFNVYVLYVTYYPLPILPYYVNYLISSTANYADATDYPAAFPYNSAVIPRNLAEPTAAAETLGTNPDSSVPATSGEVSPNEEALQSCASNGDFYIASSASDITTAMSAMLKSAINSSIVVTK